MILLGIVSMQLQMIGDPIGDLIKVFKMRINETVIYIPQVAE